MRAMVNKDENRVLDDVDRKQKKMYQMTIDYPCDDSRNDGLCVFLAIVIVQLLCIEYRFEFGACKEIRFSSSWHLNDRQKSV